MIIVGLTGSIGMGKTTTAKMFERLGAFVFDADAAVHALYDKGGAAVPLIRAVFPDAVKDGAVDRTVLSRHMQADPLNIKVLESFIHPMVVDARRQAMTQAQQEGRQVFIADVPLLFETGGHEQVDKIIVVSAPKHIQRQRVLARPDMSADKFAYILSQQMPDQLKRQQADFIIETGDGLDKAREQVQSVMDQLLKEAES